MVIKEPIKQFEVDFSQDNKKTFNNVIDLLNYLLSEMADRDCNIIDTFSDTYDYRYITEVIELLSNLKNSERIMML